MSLGRRFPTESLRVFRRLGISSDGFLLLTCASLARRPIHLNCSSGLQFPTGSKALPAPEYVVCGHDVGVALKTALTTAESRLRQTVQRRYVLTLGTSSTRVRRRYGEHLPAELLHFLIKQAEEDPPSLIENGGVEAALLPDVCAGLLKGSFRRGGHVLDYQVLTIDNRVVFADVVRKLLKMITTRVGDLLVEHSDFLLLFFPVFTGRHHALEAPLHFGELRWSPARKAQGLYRKPESA